MAADDGRVVIRDAVDEDLPRIKELYNALITTSTVAWTDRPQTLRQRRAWFRRQQRAGHPVLVADAGGLVVGFTAYGTFRGAGKWGGYRHSVEHTIHVAESHWGAGLGRLLLEALIERGRAAGVHVMVGAIDAENVDSIEFHRRMGFVEVARMPELGRKFDRWLTLVLMQRILDDRAPGDRPDPADAGT